ncbi:FecCD family ABC transporter permease [Brucellaceae bacterium D45D]
MKTAVIRLRRGRGMACVRPLTAMILTSMFVVILAVLHIGFGARIIGPQVVTSALMNYDPANLDHRIIIDLRLLRLLCAIVTGAALGMAGTLLQSIIRNPLGEPQILGLNAGAALAVVLATALGGTAFSTPIGRPVIASIGAALVFGLVMSMASAGKSGLTPIKATLCGVAFSAFASSVTAAILVLDEQTLTDLRIWLVGDLAGLSYPALQYAAIATGLGLTVSMLLAPYFNVLALGDDMAKGLGVNVFAVRIAGLICAAILSGAAVSIAGPIGFVGLVVPHIARQIAGNDMRLLLPLSAIGGVSLLLAADIAARVIIAPQELATGVMTAIAGAPMFIYLAARSHR